MEHVRDSDARCDWCTWYSHQWIGIGTGRLGNKGTRGDHPNYSIIKIDQNTDKSTSDLSRLAITEAPARSHQLTLV